MQVARPCFERVVDLAHHVIEHARHEELQRAAFCLVISFRLSLLRKSFETFFSDLFSVFSFSSSSGSYFEKMGSRESLRAMLLSVMCGTVVHRNVAFPGMVAVGSVSHVPVGFRAMSSVVG